MSVSMRKNLKLSPKYYGPFKILQRIGAVAYKLDLPSGTRIHPVFHVSLLKKKVGSNIIIRSQLPSVIETNGKAIPNPCVVIDRRVQKGKSEILVHWQGLSPAGATWENVNFIKNQFPGFHP